MTVRDLITQALRKIGAVGAGEALDGTDAVDALSTLNVLRDAWKAERLTIYTVAKSTIALVASQSSYSVATRPIFLEAVTYTDAGGIDAPLSLLTDDEYAAISNKSQQGRPTHAYYNPTFPTGTLTLYPVPDIAATVGIYAATPAADFTSLDDVIALPPGYERALIANLALELAPEWGAPIPNGLPQQAQESKTLIRSANVRQQDRRLLRPRRWSGDPTLGGL